MVYCCFTHIIYNQPKWLGIRQSWELNQSATLELDQPFDGDNIYHWEYVNKPTAHEQRLGEGYIRASVDPKKPCMFSIDPFILIYLAFAQVNGSTGSQIFQAYLQCRNKGTTTLHVLGGLVTNHQATWHARACRRSHKNLRPWTPFAYSSTGRGLLLN